MKETLEELLLKQKELNNKIAKLVNASYAAYGMSDIVKNDNPYSRLMALKKMGVVENYESIREKTVLVVGVGGVGSVASQMLTRCGVGKLILYDYDKVQLANMNRLFFTPMQVGLSKVRAAKETLQLINPQIIIEDYNQNITSNEGYDHVVDRILHGSLTGDRIDLVLSCVDNYSARMTINTICNRLDQVWFESGVSQDALSSHIQIMVPGEIGCFVCASPLAVSEGTEGTIKREGVCAASLPTTMGITAGFLVQNALKWLLSFGDVSFCLSYNARTDFFNNYTIGINKECKEPSCKQAQQRFAARKQKGIVETINSKKKQKLASKKAVVHSANEWGIQVVEQSNTSKKETQPHQQPKPQTKTQPMPSSSAETLQDLMDQFNSLS